MLPPRPSCRCDAWLTRRSRTSSSSSSRPSPAASPAGRCGRASRARVEALRADHASVDIGFAMVERDSSIGGGLLAGALAYRLFVLLLPTALLFVSGLGLYAGAADESARPRRQGLRPARADRVAGRGDRLERHPLADLPRHDPGARVRAGQDLPRARDRPRDRLAGNGARRAHAPERARPDRRGVPAQPRGGRITGWLRRRNEYAGLGSAPRVPGARRRSLAARLARAPAPRRRLDGLAAGRSGVRHRAARSSTSSTSTSRPGRSRGTRTRTARSGSPRRSSSRSCSSVG